VRVPHVGAQPPEAGRPMNDDDYESYALQLRTEIHEGEILLGHLRRMNKERHEGVDQGDVNALLADIDYLKRELSSLNIVMTAKANEVDLPEVDEPPSTARVRGRLRETAERVGALI
jgi:hypothetical protein